MVMVIMGFFYYTRYVTPYRLEINRQNVALKNWHREHGGLKIAVLSDIHQSLSEADRERLERAVAMTNAEGPALVFVLGDLTGRRYGGSNNAPPEEVAAILSKLEARYGIYAVLGNHDWWYDGERVRRALMDHGILVLENQFVTLTVNGKKLNVLGLPDKQTRSKVLDTGMNYPENGEPTIVLSHSPDFFADFKLPAELTLSGHTHGGQMNLPLFGRPMIPSAYGRRYAAGYVEEDWGKLFVTTGIGTSVVKMRVNCPAEVAILVLDKAE